ncbi:MAG: DUF397 domain-containing protein [Desulfarculaceae bacterium]|nr:DUF397 domain-containing protein [Desulfarculaceae bacterium]MCF8073904.1 DUF397 domain-containing protein [Desulfarculaceae bacterium]MCF8102057.1 DUF397 domain-containing protein [Desulfarculaceae bacterium]MCF8116328.1 DUF397 domain-containing protein [Desulfarculaceae bacterium]
MRNCQPVFKISSLSRRGRSCVAVAMTPGKILVKHSSRKGPVLSFTEKEWSAFIAGVKSGEFDLDLK